MSFLSLETGERRDLSLPARQTFNQLDVDACFSCAIATAYEARHLDVPSLSPAFHLFHAFGGSAALMGMTLETAHSALAQFGISRMSRYRHDPGAGTPPNAPDSDALTDGLPRRPLSSPFTGSEFRQLPGIHRAWEWISALEASLPVLIRIWLNPGYQGLSRENPEWTDRSNPGRDSHAVVIVGYQAGPRRFVVQDSRGKNRFIEGQWFIPEAQAELGPIEDAYVFGVPVERLI